MSKNSVLREDGANNYIFRSLIEGFFNHHSLYKNHVLREDDAKNNIFRGLMWGCFTIMFLCCLAPRGTQKRALFYSILQQIRVLGARQKNQQLASPGTFASGLPETPKMQFVS